MDRLLEALVNIGLPVAYLTGSKDNLGVVYTRTITEEENNIYHSVISNFDWSSQADEAWILNKNKQNAISLILDQNEPQVIATRNSQRIAMAAFHSQILKINEIIQYLNSNGATITELNPPIPWSTLIESLKLQIANEGTPST